MDLFQFQEFGYYRQLFLERGGYNDSIKKGLNILVHFVPRIGLEFLDFPSVITDQAKFMSNLLQEEQNHPYVLTSFSRCINEFDFDEDSVNAIGISLIQSARTINNAFSYFLDICSLAITASIN